MLFQNKQRNDKRYRLKNTLLKVPVNIGFKTIKRTGFLLRLKQDKLIYKHPIIAIKSHPHGMYKRGGH